MEEGQVFDLLLLGLKFNTTHLKDLLELVKGIKGLVFEGFISKLPKPLGGLKLWGIGRLVDEVNMFGAAKLGSGVPRSIVYL